MQTFLRSVCNVLLCSIYASVTIHSGPVKVRPYVSVITRSNIDLFSEFFNSIVCRKCAIIKDPITPQLCRYTTLNLVGFRTVSYKVTFSILELTMFCDAFSV